MTDTHFLTPAIQAFNTESGDILPNITGTKAFLTTLVQAASIQDPNPAAPLIRSSEMSRLSSWP